MKKNRKRNGIYREKDFYIFVGLWIIGFIAFTLIPMGYSLYTSFTKWDGVSAPQFNGVQNYIRMFVQDERFWGSLKNTLYYTVVSVPLNIGIALLLAILLNKRLPGTNIFRGIIYAPSVLAGVAVYMGWTYLYGNDTGMINHLLYKIFHIIGPNWLQDANWAMTALIIMNVFTCGSVMLIILAGLQDVPAIYYEAAKLDGASPFKMFIKITMPMLSPVLFYVLIMQVIGALQIFTQPYIMTQGGPMFSTYTFGLHLYNQAFRYYDFGYSCALAWVLFTVIMLISIVIFMSSKLWVFYREDVD